MRQARPFREEVAVAPLDGDLVTVPLTLGWFYRRIYVYLGRRGNAARLRVFLYGDQFERVLDASPKVLHALALCAGVTPPRGWVVVSFPEDSLLDTRPVRPCTLEVELRRPLRRPFRPRVVVEGLR